MYTYSYAVADSGRLGKSLERAIKEHFNRPSRVSAPGKSDIRVRYKNIEIKSGAGELGDLEGRLVKGSSLVVYVPVIDADKPLYKQEGFLLSREEFLAVIEEAGLLRVKVTSAGTVKRTIQTFWNGKLNKPHGAKYYKLLDLLYERCEMTLQEWLEA